MTHTVNPGQFKTKKILRDTLAAGRAVFFEDPAIANPRPKYSTEMQMGESLTVTNHPKRSWYARITRTAAGIKVE